MASLAKSDPYPTNTPSYRA
ncbi:hypothetical protein CCACVL1_02345 [Corchorus capsularis]|uniref:Uncharacterized protein n=1 Tax=Corchorus capsularis TaxID=210143 RepID=A0A1R3K957_COCAP|nr:hypothetical protein CCACVL1_02345 [Corchorus capsularis]